LFLGHYGVAFALKRAEPKLSLGTLFLAVQLADVLWGAFLLLGWEHATIAPDGIIPFEFTDYPISHSLIGLLVWAIVAGAVYYSWPTRDTTRHWQAAAVVAIAVFSHFPLDVLVHVRDMPISGNDSTKIGLGLWNHPTAALVAELLVFGAGLALYVTLRSHRHPVRLGRLAVMVVILLGTYIASTYGPVPPSMRVVGLSDVVLLLAMAGLAGWVDRRATPQEIQAQRLSSR